MSETTPQVLREDAASSRAAFDPSRMAANSSAVPLEWNALTEQILAAAFEVHTQLGPGLREKLYERAMVHELQTRGMTVVQQAPYAVHFKGIDLGCQIIDTVVNDLVVLELKAVEKVTEEHLAQLVGYLRFSGLPLGLVLNFNKAHLRDGIHRRINWPPRSTGALVSIAPRNSSLPSVLPH